MMHTPYYTSKTTLPHRTYTQPTYKNIPFVTTMHASAATTERPEIYNKVGDESENDDDEYERKWRGD